MSWLHSDDVSHDAFSAEHEITNDVENLVAGKFLLVTEGLFAHHGIALDHDRVFEAAAFDKSFLEKWLNIFVENEGPGVGDFFFVGLRCHFGGVKLRHAPIGTYLGAGNAEAFVRDDGDERSAFRFQMNRLTHFENTEDGVLLFDARFFDAIDEWCR